MLLPIFPDEEEREYSRRTYPVFPISVERSGLSGLKCAFCGRYYHKLGREGVSQVDVSNTGKVDRRWYGGSSVLRCRRCKKLGLNFTLDERQLIQPHFPHVPKEKMREVIADQYVTNLLNSIRDDFINWR